MNAESDEDALRPVCFMVMPFRKKQVGESAGAGAPSEIDFDALWDRVYRPAIDQAGFTPVRADLDTGSVIVKDMLERLAFADVVVADVSLPNGNVYYEVGLRHVAQESGCILFAANWSRQLFDIDQFTTVRYDLEDGGVPEVEAARIRSVVAQSITGLKHARTPWYEFISGDREQQQKRRGVFREFAERLSVFQGDVRAVRLMADGPAKKERLEALLAMPRAALAIADVAIEMLYLVRDTLDWQATLAFIENLPAAVADIPLVREQQLLALANLGQTEEAIARLELLIDRYGETPERLGLIGGRYKRLWRAARDARRAAGGASPARDERRYLRRAIEHYTRGMELDYNQYYCSSNIALLLLARGGEGDAERAVVVDHLVVAACERAIARGEDDEWTRPTLLGAAFRAREVNKVEELAARIEDEGAGRWMLKSTLGDLEDAVRQAAGTPVGAALNAVIEDLKTLL